MSPRWTRWPFKGVSEDVAIGRIGVLLWLLVGAALLCVWLQGCYLEHGEEFLSDSSTVERPTVNREDAGSSPALTAKRSPNGWCEGPVIGCIAPGSPVSSTWRGK